MKKKKKKKSNNYSNNIADENILDYTYQLVAHFPDFLLWEKRIAYFE